MNNLKAMRKRNSFLSVRDILANEIISNMKIQELYDMIDIDISKTKLFEDYERMMDRYLDTNKRVKLL